MTAIDRSYLSGIERGVRNASTEKLKSQFAPGFFENVTHTFIGLSRGNISPAPG